MSFLVCRRRRGGVSSAWRASEKHLEVCFVGLVVGRNYVWQQPEIKGNLYTYFFPILLQNKQKPIRNSCRSNLKSTPTLILWNIEEIFKILGKKPGDEAFQVSFKFLRHRWNQRLADFNRFSNNETRSCYSCNATDQVEFRIQKCQEIC